MLECLCLTILGDGDVLAIILWRKRSVDRPVVRHCDALPAPVVVVRSDEVGAVLSREAPSVSQTKCLAGSLYALQESLRRRTERHKGHK